MNMTSNKPYLIRAIYDWIVDNDQTPYILVSANYPGVQVPQEFVNDGRIVLNISPKACRGLHLENDRIIFTARFSGQSMQIFIVPAAVLAIYAKENGQGMEFPEEIHEPLPPATSGTEKGRKPALTLVKNKE
ncbi:ClpXP protease specificity-enhancing factor [Legionella brunensis]|nr:ClpXP protease specificity-enhancing factor [Legionella brunensis]